MRRTMLFGLALAACAEARAPTAPARPRTASTVEDVLVEVPALQLEVAPQLFSADAKIVGIRTPDGCRLWDAESHEHLGTFTRGCEKLVPAVRETFEMPPGPCDTCVASVRNGHQLAVARSEPPSLEVWDLDTKRIVARTTLSVPPAPNRLAWNHDGIHGVYRDNRMGGLYLWSPGQSPSLLALDGGEPHFADAVFDPQGTFAIAETDQFQRLAGGAVQCITLDRAHRTCGTFSETAAADAGPSSTEISSSWVLAASGPQWWTHKAVTSFSGERTSETFLTIFTDPLHFASGAFVTADQPIVCFRGARGGECLTEPETECGLVDVNETGAFVARRCGDKLRISTRDGRMVFERAGANIESWLSADSVLISGTVVDLARKSEKPLTSDRLESAVQSADHHVLAIVTADAVKLFALPSLTPKTTLSIHGGRASALSNDGALFATKTKEGVEVFDVATSKRLARIDAEASSLTFRSDGAVLFVASPQTFRAFDVHSGAVRKDAAVDVKPINLDPFGRVVGEGELTFRRLTDGVVLTLDEKGNAETDQGIWDGEVLLSAHRYRIGDDPFTARFVTTDDLAVRVHRQHLVRAFFDGEPIADPHIVHDK